MEINQLTKLLNLLSEVSKTDSNAEKGSFFNEYVGKYVIVRSRNEGINAGFVKSLDETGIVLTHARRIWYHRPKDKSVSWYEGVANSGLSDNSKISTIVLEKIIVEDYSITLCTDVARDLITKQPTYEQN